MQHFYDGQIRRYITQTIRVFSNFVVKYGDGTLHRVPVLYGDADRMAASIIRNNSENSVNSVPRISVYVTSIALDKDRLGDSTFVGKMHFREREVDPATGNYTSSQGRNYTVERLMPTPFKLTMKVDIWTANTDQRLQLLEQILVLFNPSLEIQTSDNYIDWTSLSVLNLNDVTWDSRSVPSGADTAIDVSTITIDTPIWISPPVKVKHLGVITKIITSIYENSDIDSSSYIDGLGIPLTDSGANLTGLLSTDYVTITDYQIQVYNNTSGIGQAVLLGANENVVSGDIDLEIPIRQGTAINWDQVFSSYPGKFISGVSKLFLIQPNGTEVIGTIAVDPIDSTILSVNWDPDTLSTNTGIDSDGLIEGVDVDYDAAGSYRPGSTGTFDAIINPLSIGPNDKKFIARYGALAAGRRYLIIEDIGNVINTDGADAWKSTTNVDLIAKANDIIEWTGTAWQVVFDSAQYGDTMVWQTNIYTGVQYLWNGVQWIKSFEGEYGPGQWRIVL